MFLTLEKIRENNSNICIGLLWEFNELFEQKDVERWN